LVAVIAAAASTFAMAQEFRTVTLMSWNVENLFDTIDDPGNPFDDTFLPKAVKDARPRHEAHCRAVNLIPAFARECIEIDWTEEKLRRKLQAIADVIRAVRPQPDVIILPELENPGILSRLNSEFLAGLGYATQRDSSGGNRGSRGAKVTQSAAFEWTGAVHIGGSARP
jgi:hypothetical protein